MTSNVVQTRLQKLLQNWKSILDARKKCNLHLSPSKTRICSISTTILGLIWTQGRLSVSPHRATLSSCPPPNTVGGLRSFIGAYKALSRDLINSPNLLHGLIILCPAKSLVLQYFGRRSYLRRSIQLKSHLIKENKSSQLKSH